MLTMIQYTSESCERVMKFNYICATLVVGSTVIMYTSHDEPTTMILYSSHDTSLLTEFTHSITNCFIGANCEQRFRMVRRSRK